MNMTRRWFIGGMASFGAFEGCRLSAAEAPVGGVARLKFGVVSDIHVIAENTDVGRCGNTRTLKRALRWFDAQGVDGVLISGDMADAGLISQLQCVADAWNSVFPGGRSKLGGRPVEKLFIYGNHDWEGAGYNTSIFGRPSKELVQDQIRVIGLKKAWEEVFGEEYAPIYSKSVNGYTFIGGHWDGANGSGWGKGPDIRPFFAEHGGKIDPSRPFFYFQHPHPKNTCYGSWASATDGGITTEVLSKFPNAIAFSGHSHYPLLDERGIWQGAFTSIGAGSLRYVGCPHAEFAEEGGFENSAGDEKKRKGTTGKTMWKVGAHDERSGMLLSVYDDHITINRRDFVNDCELGPDWVMPLPAAESKPFAFTEHAKRFTAPEFAPKAKLSTSRGRRKIGKGKSEKEIDVINLSVPAAQQTFANRVWRYNIQVELKDGGEVMLTRRVLSPDYYLPLEKAVKSFFLPVPVGDLPADKEFRFSVVPANCFGQCGKPLTTDYLKV